MVRNKTESGKRNYKLVLKIVGMIFIVIFLAIVAGGLMRAYHHNASFVDATDVQTQVAKATVLYDLQSRGAPSNYSLKISDKVRTIDSRDSDVGKHNIIEASVYNQTVRHMYIIDADSGKILIYSMTEFREGMPMPQANSYRNDGPDQGPPRKSGMMLGRFLGP